MRKISTNTDMLCFSIDQSATLANNILFCPVKLIISQRRATLSRLIFQFTFANFSCSFVGH